MSDEWKVDDHTGVISVTLWNTLSESANRIGKSFEISDASVHADPHDWLIGDLIHVRGRLVSFRGQMQLTASHIGNPKNYPDTRQPSSVIPTRKHGI